MAFDEELGERIRERLVRMKNVEEKRMLGWLGFLLNGSMMAGVWTESLVV